jgi:N-acetylglucosamine kinase-like BadF-type ATPase
MSETQPQSDQPNGNDEAKSRSPDHPSASPNSVDWRNQLLGAKHLGYVIGIDGGGTKTEAVILDTSGRVCGSGLAGASSFDKTALEHATTSIGAAIDAARADAGLTAAPFDAAFFGMAGVTSQTDRDTVRGIARALRVASEDRIGVDHDLRAALAGGLSGRPGIVIIAGTGSSVYGVNAAGQNWKAGGYGTLISDDGGSFWIGARAIRAAAMIADGRLPRELTPLLYTPVMRDLGITHVDDLMHRLHVAGIEPSAVAALAPHLIAAARAGDAYSTGVLREGMGELARCVEAVARALEMKHTAFEIALVGGVFRNGDLVITHLVEALAGYALTCSIKPAELPPAHGAALLALAISNFKLQISDFRLTIDD